MAAGGDIGVGVEGLGMFIGTLLSGHVEPDPEGRPAGAHPERHPETDRGAGAVALEGHPVFRRFQADVPAGRQRDVVAGIDPGALRGDALQDVQTRLGRQRLARADDPARARDGGAITASCAQEILIEGRGIGHGV